MHFYVYLQLDLEGKSTYYQVNLLLGCFGEAPGLPAYFAKTEKLDKIYFQVESIKFKKKFLFFSFQNFFLIEIDKT